MILTVGDTTTCKDTRNIAVYLENMSRGICLIINDSWLKSNNLSFYYMTSEIGQILLEKVMIYNYRAIISAHRRSMTESLVEMYLERATLGTHTYSVARRGIEMS